jgi:glycosyltransferase involved in cell wall biosynthesis
MAAGSAGLASGPRSRPRHEGPVRVLFVHGSLEIGGAEEVRLSLLSCLDRSRYQATICCLQQGGAIADEAAAMGYRVIVLGQRAHALSLPTLRALRGLIRTSRPHIVQTSLPRANYWGRITAALEGVPVVIAEEHTVAGKSDWARPVIERVLGPHTDCVIAVSESVREVVAARDRASGRRPTVVIPNPVNAQRLQQQRDREEVRAELGATDGAALMVQAGRMNRVRGAKGHDLLMEALATLPPGASPMTCLLLGDGPARAELEALARRLRVADRVKFLGYRRDVASLLGAADLFAFPSRVEGMPIALMEAMWMGLPIVASDIPANRETLAAGKYGRLVPPTQPKALAEAIARLGADTQGSIALGQRARAYAREAFSPARYAERVSRLWEELLARRQAEARGTDAGRASPAALAAAGAGRARERKRQ